MPNNPFDQFDVESGEANPFDQFDSQAPKQQPQSQLAGQQVPNMQVDSPLSVPEHSAFWDALAVMNRNFATVANGTLQAAAQGMGFLGVDTTNFQKKIAEHQQANEIMYQQGMKSSPVLGTVADVASSIGAAVSAPGAQPFLAQSLGTNLVGRVTGAGMASGIASGEQYVEGGDPNTRLENAATGAVLGTAFQGAGEAIGKGIQKGASKLFSHSADEATAIANSSDVAPTLGSVTGNKSLQNMETGLAYVPGLGTKGALSSRAQQVGEVVGDTLEGMGVGPSTSTSELSNALKTDIKTMYKAASDLTNKKYNTAMEIGEAMGDRIQIPNAAGIAQKALDTIDQAGSEGFKSFKPTTKAGKFLNELAAQTNGEGVSPKFFETLRKNTGTTASSLFKSADTDNLGPVFKEIKKALDVDLESAGSVSTPFKEALQDARDTYINKKLPFKEIGSLDKIVKDKMSVDKLVNSVVQNNAPDATANILKQLSPEGKTLFSKAVVNKAYTAALNTDESLDLGKLSANLHKLGETIDALPKQEQLKIKGMQKLITRTEYIRKAAKAPSMSGAATLGGLGAGTYVANVLGQLPTVLVGAAGALGVSKALTSPKLAKALVKLARSKTGTAATDRLIGDVGQGIIDSVKRAVSKEGLKTGIKTGTIPAASVGLGTTEDN